ncbi:MAG: DUF2141 domain-containing protein [Pseudomonadota bacterium]
MAKRGYQWTALIVAAAFGTEAGHAATAELRLCLEGLRSTRGMVRLCLAREVAAFPDCKEGASVRREMPVGAGPEHCFTLTALQPGLYAISLFHDENANARLDKTMSIPREGFGFSRNPKIGFGPPRFDAARIDVKSGQNSETIKVRYLL